MDIPRLGIIGSGEGTNFAAVARAIADGTLTAEIVTVISDVADSGILVKARALGLPAHFLDPGPWKTKLDDAAQVRLADMLTAARVDLVICAGFMRRLKEPVLQSFRNRILNIHPSLLPQFAGRDAIVMVMEAAVSETGCTVHLVDEGIDSGETLAQARVPVLRGDTPDSLRARVHEAEHALYPRAIRDYWARLTGTFPQLRQ
jgi:phosphoribosylglycinamide formyltransferase-1